MNASAIDITSGDTGSALCFWLTLCIRKVAREDVFDYVSDPSTVPIWQSDALYQTQISPGPVGEGTRFDNRKRFLGYTFSAVTEVITYRRPTEFAFRSNERPEYMFTYRFAPDGQGTAINVEAEFAKLPGLFWLVPRRFLRRAIAAELRGNHLTLKRILEARTLQPS